MKNPSSTPVSHPKTWRRQPSLFLVGLGNPGAMYAATRHNAGKLFASWIKDHPIDGVEVIETDCYMNESGPAIGKILSAKGRRGSSPTSDPNSLLPLIVVHDDLDLALGSFKIQVAKGPREHRGLLSVEAALQTDRFIRVRIGVDSRNAPVEGQKESGETFVLKPFRRDEKKTLKSIFPIIHSALAHETSTRFVRA